MIQIGIGVKKGLIKEKNVLIKQQLLVPRKSDFIIENDDLWKNILSSSAKNTGIPITGSNIKPEFRPVFSDTITMMNREMMRHSYRVAHRLEILTHISHNPQVNDENLGIDIIIKTQFQNIGGKNMYPVAKRSEGKWILTGMTAWELPREFHALYIFHHTRSISEIT